VETNAAKGAEARTAGREDSVAAAGPKLPVSASGSAVAVSAPAAIQVRGARTHNLTGIDVDVPIGGLTAVVGVSGSGKSSLAIGTLFAESRRRHVASLGERERRMLTPGVTPRVDSIEHLPPAVALAQSSGSDRVSSRATVADLADLSDTLERIWSSDGVLRCPGCGDPLPSLTLERMLDRIEAEPEGTRAQLLAPMGRVGRTEFAERLATVRREGFLRIRLGDEFLPIDPPPTFPPEPTPLRFDMVVDRQVLRPGLRTRLAESLETALRHGRGAALIHLDRGGVREDVPLRLRPGCDRCDLQFEEPCPEHLRPTVAAGACSGCGGSGTMERGATVRDAQRPLLEGALDGPELSEPGKAQLLAGLTARLPSGTDLTAPLVTHSEATLAALFGDGSSDGALAETLDELMDGEEDPAKVVEWSSLRDSQRPSPATCSECSGDRRSVIGRSLRFEGMSLGEFLRLDVTQARGLVCTWRSARAPRLANETERGSAEGRSRADELDAEKVSSSTARRLGELEERLALLERTGLGYLPLGRTIGTLSGGEAQRVRLSGCIRSGLTRAIYVLDEPTRGLHSSDVNRLLEVIADLRDVGNTVVVVDHDPAIERSADQVIEIGPGGGAAGGRLVRCEPRGGIEPRRLTALPQPSDPEREQQGRAFEGTAHPEPTSVPCRVEPDAGATERVLFEGFVRHNLRGDPLEFPTRRLTAVVGVSGSGKSTLIRDGLIPAIRGALDPFGRRDRSDRRLTLPETVRRLMVADQRPAGRSPRSIPASAAGLLPALRDLFAGTRDAKARGFKASRFQFGSKEGRCGACQGTGLDARASAEAEVMAAPCPVCRGARLNRATLACRYRGCSFAEILRLTAAEAAGFFADHPRLAPSLRVLVETGLGYLQLDRAMSTLSGGEAQRVKLARQLIAGVEPGALFALDEPTTGLHRRDVAGLLTLFRRLIERGHTVLVIEHHLDLIRAADQVVELGPGAGAAGGRIVFSGTPTDLAGADTPTGAALRRQER
jgi:excinuclease ABC subunit A